MKNIILILCVIAFLYSCDRNPVEVGYSPHVYMLQHGSSGITGNHYLKYRELYPEKEYIWIRYESDKSLIISKKHIKNLCDENID